LIFEAASRQNIRQESVGMSCFSHPRCMISKNLSPVFQTQNTFRVKGQ